MLKDFNLQRIYENKLLTREREKIRKGFLFLFDYFVHDVKEKKTDSIVFREWIFNRGEDKGERYMSEYSSEEMVVDYMASMTDRYFLNAYQNIKSS